MKGQEYQKELSDTTVFTILAEEGIRQVKDVKKLLIGDAWFG